MHGAHNRMDVYLIAAPDADVDTTVLPVIRDVAGEFGRMYDVEPHRCVCCVRPSGRMRSIATSVTPRQTGTLTHWSGHYLRLTFA